jgi:hypothetical protein
MSVPAEGANETVPVRIRITLNEEVVYDESHSVLEERFEFEVPPIPPTDNGLLGTGAIAISAIGQSAGLLIGASVGVVQLLHYLANQPVKVFVETALAGPALAAVTKAVIENVCVKIKETLQARKVKNSRVLLYGPDGKAIDWEKKD